MVRVCVLGLLLTTAGCVRPAGGTNTGSQPDERGRGGGDACKPGGSCSQYGERCRNGEHHCKCSSPCTGADMPETAHVLAWACTRRPRGCPDEVPRNGEPCGRKELRCSYGTCGGASAICEGGEWQVIEYSPPPSAEF